MATKKYHYFYKITNNVNGHFYYGVHNTNNINDGYMGSGARLNIAYKKYGIENFTKEILKFFNSSKEAFDYEAEIVTENLTKDKNCYNIALGGNPTNVGITKGKVTVKDKNNNFYLVAIDDPRYISGELVSVMCGLVHTKDKNGKIYTVSVTDPRYLSGELYPLYTGTRWSDESKEKLKKIFAEKQHQKGEKNSQYNTKWIYKNDITKKVKKEELDLYLNDGWKLGRLYIKRKEA